MRQQPMTYIEVMLINKRVKEISEIFDTCEDDDILDNLEAELNGLMEDLNRSIQLTKIKESGLRLVR